MSSWRRIEGNPREVKGIDHETGKIIAVVDMQVGTAADLPELGEEVENYIVAAGSIAQIVEADTFVTLSGDSEEWWPDQSGTKAGKTLSAYPTLKKTVDEDALSLEPFQEPIDDYEPEGGEDDAELL